MRNTAPSHLPDVLYDSVLKQTNLHPILEQNPLSQRSPDDAVWAKPRHLAGSRSGLRNEQNR
jgi:hypothetical protein